VRDRSRSSECVRDTVKVSACEIELQHIQLYVSECVQDGVATCTVVGV